MWHSVKLLFRCAVKSGPPSRPLMDESTILVQADSTREAEARALLFATDMETEYKNQYDELVTWRFIALLDIFKIGQQELRNGTQVYSRTYRQGNRDKGRVPRTPRW